MLAPLPNPGDQIEIRLRDRNHKVVVHDRYEDEALVWYLTGFYVAPLHLDRKCGKYYCPESALQSHFTIDSDEDTDVPS